MSDISPEKQPPVNQPAPASKSKKIYWITGILVILLLSVAAYFHFKPATDDKPAPEIKRAEPLYHRDEPAEKQIFQEDYRAKVREMLDSGKSVMEISKETKIRIDEVRKIKKEYKKSKSGS